MKSGERKKLEKWVEEGARAGENGGKRRRRERHVSVAYARNSVIRSTLWPGVSMADLLLRPESECWLRDHLG